MHWIFIAIVLIVIFGFLYFDTYYYENIKKPQYTEEQLLENIKRSKLLLKSLQNKTWTTKEEIDYRIDVLDFWEHEYERTKKYNERHNK